MRGEWVDIRYRDFWDLPRMFVFCVDRRLYLADCMFDEAIDDYPDSYELFELPADAEESLDGSWEHLRGRTIRSLGRIAVSDVVFDDTKRRQVRISSFKGRLEPTGAPGGDKE